MSGTARRLPERARAALVEVQIQAKLAGLTTEELQREIHAARVLASFREIDRRYLRGDATREELAAMLPDGVPPEMLDRYIDGLRQMIDEGTSWEEARALTATTAFSGSQPEVVEWLRGEERAAAARNSESLRSVAEAVRA